MTTTLRGCVCGLVFGVAFAAAGCGGGAAQFPVEGQVLWEETGKPATELAGATVLFEPVEQKGASPNGELRPDGAFTLKAPAGKYKVAVAPIVQADPEKKDKPLVHPDYTMPRLTPLEITVSADKNDNVRIKVKKAR